MIFSICRKVIPMPPDKYIIRIYHTHVNRLLDIFSYENHGNEQNWAIWYTRYSEKNQAELNRRISDIEAGKNLTAHELIEIDDE